MLTRGITPKRRASENVVSFLCLSEPTPWLAPCLFGTLMRLIYAQNTIDHGKQMKFDMQRIHASQRMITPQLQGKTIACEVYNI